MRHYDFSIDVIIPVFNAQQYVVEAIRSVELQTYLPNKIIIVDDGSSDKSFEIVKNYIKDKPIFKHITKENGGPNSARNFGLLYSNSNYIAFLDADDLWEKDKLEKQIEIFKQSKSENLGVVYCDFDFIDAKSNLLNIQSRNKRYLKGNIKRFLYFGNCVLGSASSVLIDRKVFSTCGVFSEKIFCSEDWEMWFRISKSFQYDYSKLKLVKIRTTENSNSKNEVKVIHGLIYLVHIFLLEKSEIIVKKAIIYNLLVNYYSLMKSSHSKIKTTITYFSKFDKDINIFIFKNIDILIMYLIKCFFHAVKKSRYTK